MFIHAGREPTAPWTTEIHTMPLTVFYVSQSGKTKLNHTQTLLSPLCYFWCQKLPLSKNKEGESEGWAVLDVNRSF